jgi:hypothetical protein
MTSFDYNRDTARRAEILAPYVAREDDDPEDDAFVRLSGIPFSAALALLEEHFLDPDDQQNYAPTAGEILEMLALNPRLTAHGYAIGIDRSDYRVTFEGIEGVVPTEVALDLLIDYGYADERSASMLDDRYSSIYLWWD